MALYDDIKVLDKSIADAYRAATTNAAGKVDKAGADAILTAAAKGGDIGGAKLAALFLIWRMGDFSADGLKAWEELMVSAFFGNGTGKLLKTTAELAPILDALSLAATSVDFTGPKTGLTYNGQQYEAMKQLVRDGKIHIVEADHRGALPKSIGGAYHAQGNALFLFPPTSKDDRIKAIVHELTHAVQDWNDVNGMTEYVETDAYLAEALAFRKMAGSLSRKSPFYQAVEMIRAGDAKVNNPAWNGTMKKPGVYDQTADVVGESPDYKAEKGKIRSTTAGETGTPEKQILANILKNLNKKTPAAPTTPAKPTSAPGKNPTPAPRMNR